jgi:hypothetical protein
MLVSGTPISVLAEQLAAKLKQTVVEQPILVKQLGVYFTSRAHLLVILKVCGGGLQTMI